MQIKSPMQPMQGGMFNSIPPSPIGLNLGMGYYTGSYTYQNPYIVAKQIEEQKRREREEHKQNIDTFKRLSKIYHRYNNDNVGDEYLSNIYDPDDVKINKESVDYQQLLNIKSNGINVDYLHNQGLDNINRMIQEEKKIVPDDCNFIEYSNLAIHLYNNMLNRKLIEQERDVSKLYNRKHYNKLLNLHNNVNQFKGVNIDDQTITLPDGVVHRTILDRKKKFLDAILKGNNMTNLGG